MSGMPSSVFESIPLRGRRIALKPISPADVPKLFELIRTAESERPWRVDVDQLTPEMFSQVIWSNTSAAFLVNADDGSDTEPVLVGLLQIHSLDLRSKHAHISYVVSKEHRLSGWTIEAVILATNYAFSMWPLRKLYLQTRASNLEQFASAAGRVMTEEARLRDHLIAGDSHEDLVQFAITRDDYLNRRDLFLRAVAPRSA